MLAFGSPLGLHNSVSLGVVSAVARQLEPESPMIYVQTDASINPGSSGGPLVDVTRPARRHQHADRLAGRRQRRPRVRRAEQHRPHRLRADQKDRTRAPRRHRRPRADHDAGAGGRPEAAARLRRRRRPTSSRRVRRRGRGCDPGDLVLTLDGKPMENGRQLQVSLYRRVVGDVVTLEILRDGQTLKVPVAMAERPRIRSPACRRRSIRARTSCRGWAFSA